MKKMPEKYKKEFIKLQSERFRSSVQLFSLVLMGLYYLGSISINLVIYKELPIHVMFSLALIAGSSISVFLVSKKTKRIAVLKVSAFLLFAVSLLIITSNTLVFMAPLSLVLGIYLFLLFSFAFSFPWKAYESIVVSLFTGWFYTLYFVAFESTYGNMENRFTALEYYEGMVILLISMIIIFAIKRDMISWIMDNFILHKNLEEKTAQMQKELELATRVHKRLIPRSTSTQLADIAVSYIPMHYIGGDYAKFIQIDNDKLLFLISDVTGHGVPAALIVNALHSELDLLIKENHNPGKLLKSLNEHMAKDLEDVKMLLSVFCGILDYSEMKFTYSNYGHLPQYMYRVSNSAIEKLSAQTTLIGVTLQDQEIYQTRIPFESGDQLLLFTDGLTEAISDAGEDYGDERVEDFIKNNYAMPPETFNAKLVDELNAFTGNEFRDDVFLLNIRTK